MPPHDDRPGEGMQDMRGCASHGPAFPGCVCRHTSRDHMTFRRLRHTHRLSVFCSAREALPALIAALSAAGYTIPTPPAAPVSPVHYSNIIATGASPVSADSLAPPLAQNPTHEEQSQRHQRTPPAVPSVYLQTKLCAAPVPALRVVPAHEKTDTFVIQDGRHRHLTTSLRV